MIKEDKFKKYAKPLFIFIVLITIVLAAFIPYIKFDYDFEKFFPKDDIDTRFYFKHRVLFQSENDFLVLAIERNDGIFNKKFLEKVEKLKRKIEKKKYVLFVRSITSERELSFRKGFFGLEKLPFKPYINFKNEELQNDSIKIFQHPELIHNLLSEDAKSLCLFIKHKDFLPGVKSKVLIKEIENEVKNFKFKDFRFAGRTKAQNFYIGKITSELFMFLMFSIVLIFLFLWIAFKSLWGLLLPQIVLFMSLIWILGFMVVFHEPINIILSILPSIMFVVTMSYVIHLINRYLDYLRTGMTKYDAIKLSLKEVGVATFLNAFTTSVGFLSLCFIDISPIQSFGAVTGIGVLITFVVSIVVLPISFYIFPSPNKITETKEVPFWNRLLRKLFILNFRRRKLILGISIFITIFFSATSFLIKSNNYLIDDLRPKEKLKQDYAFFEKKYGGVRPLELAINIKNGNDCWNYEVLKELDKIETYLENVYKVKLNLSIVRYFKIMNQAAHNGSKDYFRLPNSQREIKQIKPIIKLAEKGRLLRFVADTSETKLRISANIPDWGNRKVSQKNKKFEEFVKNNIDSNLISVRNTGTAQLIDKNLGMLTSSLVEGILFSVLIIVAMMLIIYRSPKLVFLSVIPNLIPLVVMSGLMGLLGVDLKISTAVIFTISLGIAFDDSIQFLAKYKIELDKGSSNLFALKTAYLMTGKGMIVSSLIVCSGFLTLLFSSFTGTFMMGLMVSVTLFVALVSVVILLPVLLMLFYKPKQRKIKN